jgi:hypothetical protein
VGEYFCSQLSLLADLCLDRNYVSIRFVEEKFSFELLVTILKTPASTPKIKAPVCRLLRCLYIDRDPQIEIKYPRLIRTSLSDSGDASSQTKIQFLLLQEIISDYLHSELDLRHCDELSSEMLDLLLALMKFGYFSSEAQLQDVVAPLVNLLDQHRSWPEDQVIGPTAPDFRGSVHPLPQLTSDPIPEQSEKKQIWIPTLRSSGKNAKDAKSQNSIQPYPLVSESGSDIRRPEGAGGGSEIRDEGTPPLALVHFYWWDPSQQRNWCQYLLERLECTTFLVFVLILVCASTGIAIINVGFGHSVGDQALRILVAADLTISLIFVLELLARVCCTYVVDGELISFLTNRYKLLDVVVVRFSIDRPSLASPLPGRP